MEHFLLAFKTVLPLFLVIFAGAVFTRSKVKTSGWVDVLNRYALYIGFPALVIASLMDLETGKESYSELIIYTSVYIVFCMILAFPIARIFRLSTNMLRSLFLILPFGNFAYLGMPVLENAYGKEILPAAAIISAIYLFWLLTLGIILVEIYGDNKIQPRKLVLSLVQNPLLLSVLAGLIIVVFRIQLPGFLDKTIRLFAGSVTAVVLFSLGIFLGMQQFGKLQEWYRVLVLVVLTMLILPFIFYLVLAQTNIPAQLLKASVIDASMPLGLTPYALSVLYNLKTTLVARVVVLGTMVSVLVIPLWMVILG